MKDNTAEQPRQQTADAMLVPRQPETLSPAAAAERTR
jgi:hypothetical protein